MTFVQHKRIFIMLLSCVAIILVAAEAASNPPNDAAVNRDSREDIVAENLVPPTGSLYIEEAAPSYPIEAFQNDPRMRDIEAGAIYVEWLPERLPMLERQADTPLPLASLTKIMTAYTALEEVGPDASVTISPDAIRQPGDHGQVDGLTYQLDEALGYVLALSSNDVAYAVQESVSASMTQEVLSGRSVAINSFVRRMNAYAEELGLIQTYYVDAIGFDESEKLSGSYGTAREVAQLMQIAKERYPVEIGDASVLSSISQGERRFPNTNTLVDSREVQFSKTGYTDLAGGNLAVIVDTIPGELAVVVMRSSFEGRVKDVELLITVFEDWHRNYVEVD